MSFVTPYSPTPSLVATFQPGAAPRDGRLTVGRHADNQSVSSSPLCAHRLYTIGTVGSCAFPFFTNMPCGRWVLLPILLPIPTAFAITARISSLVVYIFA